MDPPRITSPIPGIQQVLAYQTGEQQQRTPFTQGQLLQGLISARSGDHLFTLDIGGRRFQAESSTPLTVGQRLDLQVASLAPRIELRVISDPVSRLIGASMHLIGQQAESLASLPALADQAERLDRLSSDSRQTLRFFADSLSQPARAATAHRLPPVAAEILTSVAAALNAPQADPMAQLPAQLAALLPRLIASGTLPPQLAQSAAELATLFADLARTPSAALPALPTGTTASEPPQGDMLARLALLKQLPPGSGLEGTVDRLLLPLLLPLDPDGGPAHPLQQLLRLLVDAGLQDQSTTAQPPDGERLRQVIDRLGIAMEQSLASGNREAAVQTLKFALLELAQQLPATDRSGEQAGQMAKSIELFQLLQIRMAGEALFFLPLPFSFLDQGYLLVDANSSGKEEGQVEERQAERYSLHLKLEGLGNLQITLHQDNGKLNLRFLTEDMDRARFLAGHRGELSQWITDASLKSVQFLTGAKDPAKTLLTRIAGGTTGMIDTSA